MIRISDHTIKFSNAGKLTLLRDFLAEYRRVAALYLNYLWNNEYVWNTKTLNISEQQYDYPKFLPANINSILLSNTNLSARALKCCSTQVCGMIGAALKKQCKRIYQLNKLKAEGKDYTKLLNKINKTKIVKPNTNNLYPELNSICCNFQNAISVKSFDGFIILSSLGKTYGKILLPIKYHKQSNKWKSKGKLLNSFLISDKTINFRWDIPNSKTKDAGLVVGADQGKLDVLTLSTGVATPKKDIHGHSLDSILLKLSRKKKG